MKNHILLEVLIYCSFFLITSSAFAVTKLHCQIIESDGLGNHYEWAVEKELKNGRISIEEFSRADRKIRYFAVANIDFQTVSTEISDSTDKLSLNRMISFADLKVGERTSKIIFQKDKDGDSTKEVEMYVFVCLLTE